MMSSFYYVTITGTMLILLLGQEVAGSSKVTIDHRPLEDDSSVAQLCDSSMGKDIRISRISSISKLHGYFSSSDNNQKCRNLYQEPVNHLKALMDLGSENVCSHAMMEGLNKFHWHYIVGSLSKSWRKASNGTLPEPLRVFFMNYAQEVAENCKDSLRRRLEQAAANSKDEAAIFESLYVNKFGLLINRMSNILEPQSHIKKYDDFLLLWDQLIDKERMKGRSVEQKVDRTTGEMVLVSLRVKHPEQVWLIQRKCRQELRPIYGRTVLPVMRLISIGYGGESQKREDIAGSELVKNWYAITQLCQLVLPVNFYLDKALKKEQVTVLSPEESANLVAPEGSLAAEQVSDSWATIEVESIRLPDVLPTSNQLDKQVKANLKARGHFYRRVIRNTIKMTNGQLKSKLKDLFISKKVGKNKFVVVNGESTLKKQLAGQEKNLLAEDDDDDDRDGAKQANSGSSISRRLFRSKRSSVLNVIFNVFVVVCIVAVVTFFMYMLIVTLIGAAG